MAFKKGQVANPLGGNAAKLKYGGIDIMQLARIESVDAVRIIGKILKDEETPKPVRLKAAELLLDRGYGKATQYIDQTNRNELENLTDVELRQRIAALQDKLGTMLDS